MTTLALEAPARVALATGGFLLLTAALGASRGGRAPAGPAGRGRVRWGRRVLSPLSGALAGLAGRSEVLRRRGADGTAGRRLAGAGASSWVADVCLDAAERRADRAARRGRAAPAAGADALLEALAGLRAGSAVLACGLCWALLPLLGSLSLPLGPVVGIGAALVPDAALRRHARLAADRTAFALPGTLELLAACCRGGLPLEAALEVAEGHCSDPLRGVLARARRRQAAGQDPSVALRVEAEVVGIDEVVALGRLVERHHQLGLPLEGPLLGRADAARTRAHTSAVGGAGRGVAMASLLTAMVVAPCCVGILALWVISATVMQSGII